MLRMWFFVNMLCKFREILTVSVHVLFIVCFIDLFSHVHDRSNHVANPKKVLRASRWENH